MVQLIRFFWLFLGLVTVSPAIAKAPAYVVDLNQLDQPLGLYLDLLEESSEPPLTFEEVLAFSDEMFTLQTKPAPSLGYPKNPFWVKFRLDNPHEQPIERLLVLERGSKLTLTYYFPKGDGTFHVRRIGHNESSVGDLYSRHAVFRVMMPAKSSQEIIIRYQTFTAGNLALRLVEERTFAAQEWRDQLVFGLYYGFIIAVAAYIFVVAMVLRHRLYFWFLAYLVFAFLYQSQVEGYMYTWAWHGYNAIGNQVNTACGVIFAATTIEFARAFLHSRQYMPWLHRFLWLPYVFIVGSLIVFPFAPWLGNKFGNWAGQLGIFFLLILAFVAVFRRLPQSKTYFAAFIVFLSLSIVFLLKQQGLFDESQIANYAQAIGTAVSSLIFAIALADRFRSMREQQEIALRANEERLNHLVAERTVELEAAKKKAEDILGDLQKAEANLVEAEKMSSLGQLVAGVAHEINTPIGVALTAATHLTDETKNIGKLFDDGQLKKNDFQGFLERAREAVRIMKGNIDRAAILIRSFKQVAVDQTADERREFDLKTVLDEVMMAVGHRLRRHQHRLQISCPNNLFCDSYPGALGQVLTNLVTNATAHAFEDDVPGDLAITATPEDDGRQVLIQVRDNGKGIEPEHLARVFDPFFTTKRGQGSTGLGLNVTWNLVTQRLGGTIDVTSELGEGTAFRVRIPIRAPIQKPILNEALA